MSADLNQVGAIPAPPGVTPQLGKNSASHRAAWTAASIVMLVVPTVLVFMRSYLQLKLRKWKAVDSVCFIAWCLSVANLGIGLDLLNYGEGDHGWNVDPANFSHFAKNLNIMQAVYMVGVLFAKTAILMQLLQLFALADQKARRWTLIAMIGLNVMFFTAIALIAIFQCTPREKIWHPSIPGSCADIQKAFIVTGVINSGQDILILVLPMWWVWQLRLAWRKKIPYAIVFAAGIFACFCSIMRLAWAVITANSSDITDVLMPCALWASAELSCGIAICALPVARAMFNRAKSRGNSYDYSDQEKGSGPARGRRGRLVSDDSLLYSQDPKTPCTMETALSSNMGSFSTQGGNSPQERTPKLPATAITRSVEVDMVFEHA